MTRPCGLSIVSPVQAERGRPSPARGREAREAEGRNIMARSAAEREIGKNLAAHRAEAKPMSGEAGADDEARDLAPAHRAPARRPA